MDTKPKLKLAGDWARDIAALYRRVAEESDWPPKKQMNYAEAAKYEAIGSRMDGVVV